MFGNDIVSETMYVSITQTNCFKHLYKTLHDHPPVKNSSVPSYRTFLKELAEKFEATNWLDTTPTGDVHAFYNGLYSFDSFMERICDIIDVKNKDSEEAKYECWKIFKKGNLTELSHTNFHRYPDSLLYKIWLIFCKFDVTGELQIVPAVFSKFLEKLLQKAFLPTVAIYATNSDNPVNFFLFLKQINDYCLKYIPIDYGIIVLTEIYDCLFKGSLKQGYLTKVGIPMNHKRWFMLTPTTLQYFDSKLKTEKSQPKGTIYLSNLSNVKALEKNSKMDRFYFQAVCTRTGKRAKLYTEDAKERQLWIKAITKAIENQSNTASIQTLQRDNVDIGLEKWSFNFLLSMLDTTEYLITRKQSSDSILRCKSTNDLSIEKEYKGNSTISARNCFGKRSFDLCSLEIIEDDKVFITKPELPKLKREKSPPVPKRPSRKPQRPRIPSSYVEMNLRDECSSQIEVSSGYSSSSSSNRSDGEMDDCVITPEKKTPKLNHVRKAKTQIESSPLALKRQASGYVVMNIANDKSNLNNRPGKLTYPSTNEKTSTPLPKGNVAKLIRIYMHPNKNNSEASATALRVFSSAPSSPEMVTKSSLDAVKSIYRQNISLTPNLPPKPRYYL